MDIHQFRPPKTFVGVAVGFLVVVTPACNARVKHPKNSSGHEARVESVPSKAVSEPVKSKTDEDCRQSADCRAEGKCVSIAGDRCIAVRDQNCKESAGCAEQGRCVATGGACVVQKDSDCEQAACCRNEGKCRAKDGSCVTLPETLCAPSARTSTVWFTEPKHVLRCGATNLSWPSYYEKWPYFKDFLLCSGGERIYNVTLWVKDTNLETVVGAAMYPLEDKEWRPPAGILGLVCSERWCASGKFRVVNNKQISETPPLWRMFRLNPDGKGDVFSVNFCVPEDPFKKSGAAVRARRPVVERVFRFQVRRGDETLEDCCVHFRGPLPK